MDLVTEAGTEVATEVPELYGRFADTIATAWENPPIPGADDILTQALNEVQKEAQQEEAKPRLFGDETVVEIFYGDDEK